MKFSFRYFFSECDQILNLLQIWSHLQMKSLMENFIFCAALLSCIWITISTNRICRQEDIRKQKQPESNSLLCTANENKDFDHSIETATGGILQKKVFLEISLN